MPNNQRIILFTSRFHRDLRQLAKRYRRIRTDITPIIEQLQAGETPGDQIAGTGYVAFKARAANSDAQRGKSGGYRIIYQLKDQEVILLLVIYSKSDQEDISPAEIAAIIDQNL